MFQVVPENGEVLAFACVLCLFVLFLSCKPNMFYICCSLRGSFRV